MKRQHDQFAFIRGVCQRHNVVASLPCRNFRGRISGTHLIRPFERRALGAPVLLVRIRATGNIKMLRTCFPKKDTGKRCIGLDGGKERLHPGLQPGYIFVIVHTKVHPQDTSGVVDFFRFLRYLQGDTVDEKHLHSHDFPWGPMGGSYQYGRVGLDVSKSDEFRVRSNGVLLFHQVRTSPELTHEAIKGLRHDGIAQHRQGLVAAPQYLQYSADIASLSRRGGGGATVPSVQKLLSEHGHLVVAGMGASGPFSGSHFTSPRKGSRTTSILKFCGVVARRRAALEIANGFLFPGQQGEDGDVFLVEGSLALSQRRARGRQFSLGRAVLYLCSRADEATIRDALSDDEERTKSQKKATTEHHWCV